MASEATKMLIVLWKIFKKYQNLSKIRQNMKKINFSFLVPHFSPRNEKLKKTEKREFLALVGTIDTTLYLYGFLLHASLNFKEFISPSHICLIYYALHNIWTKYWVLLQKYFKFSMELNEIQSPISKPRRRVLFRGLMIKSPILTTFSTKSI